jgi:hypothetical protein
MSVDYSQWQPMDHGEYNDQQRDLFGPYWAEIGPDNRQQPDGWSWTVLYGSNGDAVADGFAASEAEAKAAVDAWVQST